MKSRMSLCSLLLGRAEWVSLTGMEETYSRSGCLVGKGQHRSQDPGRRYPPSESIRA